MYFSHRRKLADSAAEERWPLAVVSFRGDWWVIDWSLSHWSVGHGVYWSPSDVRRVQRAFTMDASPSHRHIAVSTARETLLEEFRLHVRDPVQRRPQIFTHFTSSAVLRTPTFKFLYIK